MKRMTFRVALLAATAFAPVMAHGQTASVPLPTPLPEGSASAAKGAPATSPTSPASAQLADIVVTAQRRSENLQKVPISVIALSGDALESKGVTDLPAMRVAVPGLNFQSIQGLATPRLRGIGSSASGPGIEPEVAVYVDGVYYASAAASLFSFNNVAQVAVLKGPQGTLFGRNAVGGLVQITTVDPTQEVHARGEIGYGNYDTIKGKIYLSGGLAPNVAMDFAAQATHQGKGYGTNLFNGQDTRKTDHDVALRSKLLFTPGSTTRITLSGDFADSDGTQGSIRLEPGSTPNPATGPAYGGSVWDINNDVQGFVKTRSYGGSAKLEQKVGGGITFMSLSALRFLDYSNALDLDATPKAYQAVVKYQADRQFSQELQLQSRSGGKFQWTLGAYYFDLKSSYDPNNFLLFYNNNPAPPNALFPLVGTSTYSTQTAKSFAGYAQATYEILPSTHVTGGFRYTYEKRTLTGYVVQHFTSPRPDATLAAVNPAGVTVKKPTFRIGLDTQATPDVLLYASFNRGFKSGGFNSGAINDPAYRPEILDAYEAGFKSQFLNHRGSLNASVFYYKYKDIQTQRLNNGALGIINGASATLKGLDVDAAFAVTSSFHLTGSFEILDGKYGTFLAAPISTVAGGTPVIIGDVSGNRLPVASKFTSTLGANYTARLSNGSKLEPSTTLYYNSGWFTEPDNKIRQKRFAELSATVRWTSSDDRYNVSLWGANLTNAKSRANATTLAFGNHVVSFNPPRTFGITAGFKY